MSMSWTAWSPGGDQMPPAEILQKFFGHKLEENAGDLGDMLRFLNVFKG